MTLDQMASDRREIERVSSGIMRRLGSNLYTFRLRTQRESDKMAMYTQQPFARASKVKKS